MGRQCVIIKCTNTEGSNGTLHRVPGKDTENGKRWMDFIKAANEGLKWRETSNMYICGEHFEETIASQPNSTKKRKLDRKICPTLVYGKPILKEEIQLDEPVGGECSCCSKIEELEGTINQLRTEMKVKDNEIASLKERLASAKNDIRVGRQKEKRQQERNARFESNLKSEEIVAPPNEKETDVMKIVICEVLAKLEMPHQRFSETLKEFAYQLHYYSPRAYDFLRKTFHLTLPSPRSFRLWTSHIITEPGFLHCSLKYIQERNITNSKRVFYSLAFDEIHIRKQIIFHDQQFKGFVNFGGLMKDTSDEREATAALFVMATEINGHMKIPIAYFLTNGLPAALMSEVVKNSLIEMQKAGATVLSITFDGLNSNFKSVEKLGANLNICHESFQTFIYHPMPSPPQSQSSPTGDVPTLNSALRCNGSKVFIFPDPSHMVKLLRNVFKCFQVLLDVDGNEIHWKYIEALHELQMSEGLRAANKLTCRHVNFQNQKMKTKLCVQLLSNSLSVALAVCRKLKISGFEDSNATEKFLAIVDRLFDFLNSRPYGKGFKSPLMNSNKAVWEPVFDYTVYYLKGLKVKIGGQIVPLYKTRRGTPITGLIICLSSLELIMKQQHVMKDMFAIPTYRMSQDMVELFFSAVRSRFGFNNNPNCLQLQFALRGLLCMKMEGKFNGNCTEQENIPSKICSLSNMSAVLNEDDQREDVNLNETQPEPSVVMLQDISIFGLNIVFYISGFVCSNLYSKLKCSNCILKLFPSDAEVPALLKYSTLFQMKDNGGLFLPSLVTFDVCRVCEQVIRQEYEKGVKSLQAETVRARMKSEAERQCILERLKCCGENDHALVLLKSVVDEFITTRFHHIGRNSTFLISPTSNRSVNNKTTLFSGN